MIAIIDTTITTITIVFTTIVLLSIYSKALQDDKSLPTSDPNPNVNPNSNPNPHPVISPHRHIMLDRSLASGRLNSSNPISNLWPDMSRFYRALLRWVYRPNTSTIEEDKEFAKKMVGTIILNTTDRPHAALVSYSTLTKSRHRSLQYLEASVPSATLILLLS